MPRRLNRVSLGKEALETKGMMRAKVWSAEKARCVWPPEVVRYRGTIRGIGRGMGDMGVISHTVEEPNLN